MFNDEFIIKAFKALGHPVRYKIVKYLMDSPRCVCNLNDDIGFSQSNLSQHLRILKDAKILKSEKSGLNIEYSISNEGVKDIIESGEKFIDYYLKNIK